jgi:hypothetical protein
MRAGKRRRGEEASLPETIFAFVDEEMWKGGRARRRKHRRDSAGKVVSFADDEGHGRRRVRNGTHLHNKAHRNPKNGLASVDKPRLGRGLPLMRCVRIRTMGDCHERESFIYRSRASLHADASTSCP